MAAELKGYQGFEGQLDGLWTCRRGKEVFVFNSKDTEAETTIDNQRVRIAPHSIYSSFR